MTASIEDVTKSYYALPGYNPVPVSLEADFFGRTIRSPYLLSASPVTDGLEQMNKAYKAVGMIGSRRKIKLIFDDLLREGISAEALERVHAPLGFDIGSQTVPEIAVSICAELVSHRNRGGVVPGRPDPV